MNWLQRSFSVFKVCFALYRREKWVGFLTLAYAAIYFSFYIFVFQPAFSQGHILPAPIHFTWARPSTFLPILAGEFAVFLLTFLTFFADFLITQKVLDRSFNQKRPFGRILARAFRKADVLVGWALSTTIYFHWIFPLVFQLSHGTAYLFTLAWFFAQNFFTQVLVFEDAGFRHCLWRSIQLFFVTYLEQIIMNVLLWATVWSIPTLVERGQGAHGFLPGSFLPDPQVIFFGVVVAFSMVYATVLYGSTITGMSPNSLFFKLFPETEKGVRAMLFQISRKKGVSLARQLFLQARHAILSKSLTPGEQLPSVRELSAKLDIHPLTIAKAYAELEKEGLVHTRWGKGTFVAQGKTKPQDYLRELVDDFVEKTLPMVDKPEQLYAMVDKRVRAKKG